MVARQAHNLKVAGSNPAPAPNVLGFTLLHSYISNYEKCVLSGFFERKKIAVVKKF